MVQAKWEQGAGRQEQGGTSEATNSDSDPEGAGRRA